MVREATIRKRRYEKGIHPEMIGKKFEALKPVMTEMESEYLAQITLVEQKAKAIVEAEGVTTYKVAQYVNVARQCYSLSRNFSPPTRDNEAYALLEHWNRRGLNGELLRQVCVAGGCDPAAPELPRVEGVLNDLEDVEISNPQECEVLHYDAAQKKWKNWPIPMPPVPHNLDDLDDVEIVNPQECEVLHYDAAQSKWKNSPIPPPSLGLDDLTDVEITDPEECEVLHYNAATGLWENAPAPAGVPAGVIAMWHGLLANIPAGWVLCDGNNGTPNLLARFVESVPNAVTNPGATGGSTSKTTAGHQHKSTHAQSGGSIRVQGADPWGASGLFTSTYYVNLTAGAIADTYSLVSSATDSITDIRPLFYDIAFIMKT